MDMSGTASAAHTQARSLLMGAPTCRSSAHLYLVESGNALNQRQHPRLTRSYSADYTLLKTYHSHRR